MAETDTSRATGTTGKDVLAEACVGAAALFRERWGRGPRKCRAHWAGPDTVVLVLHDIRTRAEETLVEHAERPRSSPPARRSTRSSSPS